MYATDIDSKINKRSDPDIDHINGVDRFSSETSKQSSEVGIFFELIVLQQLAFNMQKHN